MNRSSDREKLLKFEAEGREFFLTLGQNNFGNKVSLVSTLQERENL